MSAMKTSTTSLSMLSVEQVEGSTCWGRPGSASSPDISSGDVKWGNQEMNVMMINCLDG